MIDSDITFESDTLTKLLSVADPKHRPVVSGLYFSVPAFGSHVLGPSGVAPVMYNLTADGGGFEPIRDWERNSVVQADFVGAGMLLTHRTVFEALAAPWFPPSLNSTEDLGFCVRLMDAEIPIWVNTAATCGHVKPQVVDLAAYDRSRDV